MLMVEKYIIVVVIYGFMERETTLRLYISYLLNVIDVTQASFESRYSNFIAVNPNNRLTFCVVGLHRRKNTLFEDVEVIIFACHKLLYINCSLETTVYKLQFRNCCI
jgi:hypothetical protein